MAYQILGETELVQNGDNSYSFELDGNSGYDSRAILFGTSLEPQNQSGLIPLKGKGDISAFSVLSNQYIGLTKSDEITGLLDLHGYATREYTDGLSYALTGGLVLSDAGKYRKAINKKFDEQAIFGIDEDKTYNVQGTVREPNSVFAKATKGFGTGSTDTLTGQTKIMYDIMEAVDLITEYGGSPVVMLQSLPMYELNNFTAVIPGTVWQHTQTDATFVTMPGMRQRAKLSGFDFSKGNQPWIVFDRSLLFYAKVGEVRLELSNSAYDPFESFTGNTGKGDISNPGKSTGISYWTNDKIGKRAIAYLDYAYVGGENSAFTNIPSDTPE
ncbi:hypothetical protein [Pseudolactococcus insecticola]|uniref:Major capsid protein n=1 Tax=Pseudolactococcus insecticola TaxID=2709158 RepID=A0A6A0B5A1_9LACT|nr:hypothetical protein [Lactococcus insecticola]GFH39843.1 hypothetical protein Hs20B_02410 [Lactococcus insecticola]